MQRMEQVSEFKDRLVAVNRVTKVTKGGSTFRFVALVVVGDEKGRVGCGMGKAAEISDSPLARQPRLSQLSRYRIKFQATMASYAFLAGERGTRSKASISALSADTDRRYSTHRKT